MGKYSDNYFDMKIHLMMTILFFLYSTGFQLVIKYNLKKNYLLAGSDPCKRNELLHNTQFIDWAQAISELFELNRQEAQRTDGSLWPSQDRRELIIHKSNWVNVNIALYENTDKFTPSLNEKPPSEMIFPGMVQMIHCGDENTKDPL